MRPAQGLEFTLPLIVVIGMLMFWSRGLILGSQDLQVYERIGRNVIDAAAETRTIESEYPPLASVTFALVEVNSFGLSYGSAWQLFLFLVLCAGMLYLALRIGYQEGTLLAGGILTCALFLGQAVLFTRYDFVIAVLLFLAWRLHARGHYTEASAFLMVAACFKLVPVLLFPLLFVTTQAGKRRWTLFGGTIGTLVGLSLPLVVMGFRGFLGNIAYLMRYHGSRGIQIESTWSALQLLWSNIHGIKVETGAVAASVQNMFFDGWMVTVSLTLIVLSVSLLTLCAWQKTTAASSSFPRFYLATIALILALSPVFSPQYLVWLVPLLVAWFIEQHWLRPSPEPDSLGFLALTFLISLCTQWVYPYLYRELIDQSLFSVIAILNVRNVGLFILVWLLMRPFLLLRPMLVRS